MFYILVFLFTLNCLFCQSFIGIVKPLNKVNLAFALDGVLAKSFVKEGEFIQKGALLLRLDNKMQAMEVKRRQLIYADQSRLITNQKEEALLKEYLESSKQLYLKSKAISQDELRGLQLKYDTSFGNLSMTKEAKKREEIDYLLAEELLLKYDLVSPLAGIVKEIKIKPGEWAKTGETVITIIDSQTCEIEINIVIDFLPLFKQNKKFIVRANINNQIIEKEAIINYISPTADLASSLILIKASFNNEDNSFTPGVSAELVILD